MGGRTDSAHCVSQQRTGRAEMRAERAAKRRARRETGAGRAVPSPLRQCGGCSDSPVCTQRRAWRATAPAESRCGAAQGQMACGRQARRASGTAGSRRRGRGGRDGAGRSDEEQARLWGRVRHGAGRGGPCVSYLSFGMGPDKQLFVPPLLLSLSGGVDSERLGKRAERGRKDRTQGDSEGRRADERGSRDESRRRGAVSCRRRGPVRRGF